jgi:hypothetical protein
MSRPIQPVQDAPAARMRRAVWLSPLIPTVVDLGNILWWITINDYWTDNNVVALSLVQLVLLYGGAVLAIALTTGLLRRMNRLEARSALAAASFWGLCGIPAFWLYALVFEQDTRRVSMQWLAENWQAEAVSVILAWIVWGAVWRISGLPWRAPRPAPSVADRPDTLIEVLQEARALLARPDNDFAWSSWPDAVAALGEIDGLIAALRNKAPVDPPTLQVLFAPTGPIQEVGLSSGWGHAFLALAAGSMPPSPRPSSP